MFSPFQWLAIVLGTVALTAEVPGVATCVYNGRKCPVYEVIRPLTKESELRRYQPASWIATSEPVAEYTRDVSRRMYFRLRNYFNGVNSNNESLTMTVPVITMREKLNGTGMFRFTKYLLLVDSDAPDPVEKDVFKFNSNKFHVYIRTYGGRPTFQDKLDELEKLKTSIGDPSLYRAERVYFAGFNPPWVKVNRQNEVGVETI